MQVEPLSEKILESLFMPEFHNRLNKKILLRNVIEFAKEHKKEFFSWFKKSQVDMNKIHVQFTLKECLYGHRKPAPDVATEDDVMLHTAMNNVRKKFDNKCQWYDCGRKKSNGVIIHVHHIFPRSEYPELQYDERYMITYCSHHHQIWHKARNDWYWRFVGSRLVENIPDVKIIDSEYLIS